MGPEGKYFAERGLNQANMGQGCDAPTPIRDRVTLQSALDVQEKAISTAHSIMEEMERRLSSVMESTPPSDPRVASGTVSGPLGILGRIEMHTAGVRALQNRLGTILQRLQL